MFKRIQKEDRVLELFLFLSNIKTEAQSTI